MRNIKQMLALFRKYIERSKFGIPFRMDNHGVQGNGHNKALNVCQGETTSKKCQGNVHMAQVPFMKQTPHVA
jgi:hypothetical protein